MQQQEVERHKRIVVKYGGASLADHERILKAAKAIAAEAKQGTQIAVIVSAMGKTTDVLLNATRNASNGNVEKGELDEILAMGERTSVRIVSVALRAQGLQSRYFDPLDSDWPIITDHSFSNATPLLDVCKERIQQHVLPFVEQGNIPVIAGFVGRTSDNRVTTLGRGGSDTTAFIIAKALDADELILVTDADGIMSADPKIIKNPTPLPVINVNSLVGLADSGTKFIHRKALRYKDPSIRVRVISHTHGKLTAKGTLITGSLPTELGVVLESHLPAMSITVVGRGLSEQVDVIQQLTELVSTHGDLLGVSLNHDSIILYASENDHASSLLKNIHEAILRHEATLAMSIRKQLAFLKVKGAGLEETPGLIGKISETLRLNSINIYGLLTITSSILLFVNWNKKDQALHLVSRSLRDD